VMSGSAEQLLTPREVAARAQISYHAVLRAINAEELVASRLRGRLRVRRSDFDAWIEGNRVRAPKEAPLKLVDVPPRRPRPLEPGSLDALTAIEREAS
jgi:excisionase family DNA binding protein